MSLSLSRMAGQSRAQPSRGRAQAQHGLRFSTFFYAAPLWLLASRVVWHSLNSCACIYLPTNKNSIPYKHVYRCKIYVVHCTWYILDIRTGKEHWIQEGMHQQPASESTYILLCVIWILPYLYEYILYRPMYSTSTLRIERQTMNTSLMFSVVCCTLYVLYPSLSAWVRDISLGNCVYVFWVSEPQSLVSNPAS